MMQAKCAGEVCKLGVQARCASSVCGCCEWVAWLGGHAKLATECASYVRKPSVQAECASQVRRRIAPAECAS
eukprot:1110638-Alexandrium_andersonii.AAC.1